MILQILCQSLQKAKIQQIQHRRTVRKIKGSMLGCPKKLKFKFSIELCDGSKIRKTRHPLISCNFAIDIHATKNQLYHLELQKAFEIL